MRRRSSMRDVLGFGLCYFAAAIAAVCLTRFDGGVAFLWVATALLIAKLATTPRTVWPLILLVCAGFGFVATGAFGLGWVAAGPLAIANIAEAWIAVVLLRRFRAPDAPLESFRWLLGFVAAVALIAPALSGLLGAATAHVVTGHGFWPNYARWFAGHALGNLAITPLAVLVLRGHARGWPAAESPRQLVEAAASLMLVAGTAVLVFAQGRYPMLFVPMLPIMLTTFRFGRLAAAISVALLAVIGAVFTAAGSGPIGLIAGPLGGRIEFLQFYLACTVLTVLPVAADLARRGRLMQSVRESEARYRVLADNSTDIILNLDVAGRIRFASPSIRQLGGFDPDALIGRPASDLIAPEHRDRVRAAYARAIELAGGAISSEYRAVTADGEPRWFETHTRAVTNPAGRVEGLVSVVRDITDRKAVEARLAEAAMTDSLTGLFNRRAFLIELEGEIARTGPLAGGGCAALFDLDHFKRINDTHGHAAGDRVLQAFAELARRTVREGDIVARIGGEEFAVLLPGATIDQAEVVCNRLRAALSRAQTEFGGVDIGVTVSGGVASLVAADADAILRAADDALYRAKAAGRNQLALAA